MPDLSYHRDKPLNLTIAPVAERPGAVIAECRFDNAEGGPVDAYLVTPVDGEPRAGVIYQHSTGGRAAFLAEAVQVAQAGGIALTLPVTYQASGDQVAMIRQSILAIRRGADILLERTDRIGAVGHSAGAMMMGVAAGIDRRFACVVLDVGLSGLSFHYRDSTHPAIQGLRASYGERLPQLLADIAPYDAVHFIADAAPTPLLFQASRFDIGVSESEYEDFFAAAKEPKRLVWYDGGHELTDVRWTADRVGFLAEHLDLPDLPRILAERLS
ncbi:alpha/beta hydrolase family protein [Fodinicola acaciae]|uniref:alpha/beta hydrolase family protein n=1 Tax=Fodinicola acaciae TaxID=2681555 RepID=UPI0013D8CC5D|nr:prolyl oligopeptidase family serine peptidase [Fodinicola acaciae]